MRDLFFDPGAVFEFGAARFASAHFADAGCFAAGRVFPLWAFLAPGGPVFFARPRVFSVFRGRNASLFSFFSGALFFRRLTGAVLPRGAPVGALWVRCFALLRAPYGLPGSFGASAPYSGEALCFSGGD